MKPARDFSTSNFNVFVLTHMLFCGWLFATASLAAATPPPLTDQYGDTDALNNYKNAPVLAIVVNVRKLRWVGRWEESLRSSLPNLESIRIADITDEPPPTVEKVIDLLQTRVPPGVPVLIDMDNSWANTYSLDTNEPCLLLFDADQQLVSVFRGRPKGALLEEVLNALADYFPAEKQT